jgi:fibronectin type 3 domain-containing protein
MNCRHLFKLINVFILVIVLSIPATVTSATSSSNPKVISLLQDSPTPPTNLEASEKNDAKAVTLTWLASSKAVSYQIYRSRIPGTYFASNLLTSTNSLSYTDYGADKAFDAGAFFYYYVVTALDAQGNESEFSNEAVAVPHFPIPWAGSLYPTIITDYQLGSTQTFGVFGEVYLKDRPARDGIQPDTWAQFGYTEKGTVETETVDLTQWTNWSNAELAGLGFINDANARFGYSLIPEKAGTYYYTFRFSTDLGRHWTYLYYAPTTPNPALYPVSALGKINILESLDTFPPEAPALSILEPDTDITQTSIKVSWPASSSSDIYAYDIYHNTVSSPSDPGWVRVKRTLHTVGTENYSFDDTNLVSDTTYYYHLVALDSSFNSATSDPVNATTLSSPITFSLNFSIPKFTPTNAVIKLNQVTAEAPNTLGQEIWNSSAGPGSCNFTTYQCTATLTLQQNTNFRFRFSRGSQATIQTQQDGNTPAIDPSFTVTSGLTVIQRNVANWDDPLVTSYTPSGSKVIPTSKPSVTWNQEMPTNTTFVVKDMGIKVTEPGTSLGGTFSYDPITRRLTFNSASPIIGNRYYRVKVQNAVDTKGITQQSELSWNFKTDKYYLFVPVVKRN